MSRVSIQKPKPHTANDIEKLDAGGYRFELIAGELKPMSPTSRLHGRETGRLFLEIAGFVDKHDIGEYYAAETGFLLSRNPDTVLAPDISVVLRARLVGLSPIGFVAAVPDLVVETRSPNESKRKSAAKLHRWLDFGVLMVIDLDPEERRLTVHRPGQAPITLGPGDELDGYDVLPGFTMPMSRVFH